MVVIAHIQKREDLLIPVAQCPQLVVNPELQDGVWLDTTESLVVACSRNRVCPKILNELMNFRIDLLFQEGVRVLKGFYETRCGADGRLYVHE